MTVKQLIEYLTGLLEDMSVRIETAYNSIRNQQDIHDILVGNEEILLVSKEAMDADPINQLPSEFLQ